MLTQSRLILRNLVYHWRGNLAVMLGIAVGSAVLTGALLVGDSLRGSLRARAERQLGGIDSVARFPRAIRADIADGLPGRVAPVLMLPGSLQSGAKHELATPFLGGVTIIGADDRFVLAGANATDWAGKDKQVVVSELVARRLGLNTGDTVTLGVEHFSDLPRTSSVARRSVNDVTATEEVVVSAILPADDPGNDFNMTPDPAAPLNVFVPLLTLTRLASGDREPVANALLSAEPGPSIDHLNTALRAGLRIEDYGLRIREIDRKGYLSVESDQLIIPTSTVTAVESAAKDLGLRAEPTIAYIADTLAHGDRSIPYPVIAALNPASPSPLGPFLPQGVSALDDDEIVLLEWPGSELNGIPIGSKVRLSYYDPEVEGSGKLRQADLTLRGFIPLKGPAQDRDLVPEIRGVTDPRANLHDWDRPPVLPREEIKRRVPDKHPRADFFNRNKATPMAYVNLSTGQRLFSSRFGSATSVRVAPSTGGQLEATKEQLRAAVLSHLEPAADGLAFDPVRDRLLTASRGGTDFGGLFLGFSLFLIASALLLVGLLFRLALDRRGKEVGLFLAAGYRVRTVQRLLLAEGLLLSALGAALGLALGVLYNRLLLGLLLELWPDRDVANLLRPHATTASFVLGFGMTVGMAVAALWFSTRGLVKVSPPALLRGETQPAPTQSRSASTSRPWIGIACATLGIGLVFAGKFVTNPDYRAMTFVAGGGLCLVSGLAVARSWMKQTRHRSVNGRGVTALARLGARNAARNPTRSLLTMGLLASAAFLLVAVESFRRQPGSEFREVTGGSGGFNLIAEADVPLFQSFGDPLGRKDLDTLLRAQGDGQDDRALDSRVAAALEDLEGVEVFPLRLRDGDDASCMNLFQATRPRVLGVPQALIERGGFKFYEPSTSTLDETRSVWARLLEPQPDGAIPVFCEQNTAQWMLKTAVGGVITMPGDAGDELKLRIVATFTDSPFQSELLMADPAFAAAFPATMGYRSFLIRTLPEKEESVSRILSVGYRANGMIVRATRERVAAYQAVIGAYLSTFQLLGGLGLLLGVLGLAIVVLRGVWERIGELALLRAVGYRTKDLQLLIIAENALVLVLGLLIGVVAALISVAPHVAEGAAVPWGRLVVILALVLFVGLGVASGATAGILRVPVIPALRRE